MEVKKPACSYGMSCFRKNPAHFKQLSHPHLEKLLEKISGSDIILPDNLGFQCGNRTLLREQLEILRTIEENKSNSETSKDGINEKRASSLGEKSELKNKCSGETSRHSNSERRSREPHEKTIPEPNKSSVEPSRETMIDKSVRMREAVLKNMRKFGAEPEYVAPMGDFGLKWILAAPYHIFFTAVPKTPATCKQNLSVTFSEILDKSLGDIVQSLHTNMIVDFGWLIAQYLLAGQDHKSKMTIFYNPPEKETAPLPDNIFAHSIKCPTKFGTHHSKISIFQYKDSGIRIVVSTANLYQDDWEYRTQGLWISPHLPHMDDSAKSTDGDSPTSFKRDFVNFLSKYDSRMNEWRKIVERADCSSINVAFVGSVPGEFSLDDKQWGHQKLGSLLLKHTVIPENETSTTIVAQASSIGSLGPNYHTWIGNEIVGSMAKTQERRKKIPEFKFIFPTIENYKNSHDMRELSNCLCNSKQDKQQWIVGHMQKWKADETSRTRAIPHIKTFTRMSNDNKRIWWFCMGSGNLSKAAWGQRFQSKYRILSYEASVVFLPKFVTGENDFSITDDSKRSSPKFPMPYDLPLTPYTSSDRPFVDDFFRDDFEK